MDIVIYSFLGLIQGLTEFLPVSSSGHIYLFQTWFGIVPDIFTSVWLHTASLLAVLIYFRKRIVSLVQGFFAGGTERGLAIRLLVSTIITLPLALLIKTVFIDEGFLSLTVVGITLVITAIMIVISEKLAGFRSNIKWLDSILVGLAQGLAVVPGISRSGITIATLISSGVSKRAAVEFSFLLSIPIILAALLLELAELPAGSYSLLFEAKMLISFIVAVIVSYLAIAYMVRFVERHWIYFAPYCFILGLILVIL